MGEPKSEHGKKVARVRQAILDQFNKVPCPSPDDALKKKIKERDFDTWWNRFLTGDFSLGVKQKNKSKQWNWTKVGF
jgi:hypothetical protein